MLSTPKKYVKVHDCNAMQLLLPDTNRDGNFSSPTCIFYTEMRRKACEKENQVEWAVKRVSAWADVFLTKSPAFLAARRGRWRKWCGSARGRPCGPRSQPFSASAHRTPERSAARPEPRIHPACTKKKKQAWRWHFAADIWSFFFNRHSQIFCICTINIYVFI